jgi:hypothetical protein
LFWLIVLISLVGVVTMLLWQACFDAARATSSATPSGPKVCSTCGRPNDSTNPKHKMCVACGEQARAERPAAGMHAS